MVCPTCGDETKSRFAIIEPAEIREEREYCLTCDRFVDDDARLPDDADDETDADAE